MTSYAEFRRARYFPEIDGLRAVSVLMVLTFHSADPLWRRLNGHLGVPIFFVISGFLITTLLLREEAQRGRIDIKAFYLRRTFRIFPMYYLALAIFTALAVGLHMGTRPEMFLGRLPWFLTYNGEFVGPGTFSHSWSLGIEEKFYLGWPVLAFMAPLVARRRGLTVGLLLVLSIFAAGFPRIDYFAIFAPILAGCAIAIVMHGQAGYRLVAKLTWWPVTVLLLVGAVVLLILNQKDQWQNLPFAMAAAAVFPSLVVGPRWPRRLLSIRPLRYIGALAYGIYLFHPIVISIVDEAVPSDVSLVRQVIRMGLITVGSFVMAAILHRFFEKPMIRLGQRIAQRRLRGRTGPGVLQQRSPDKKDANEFVQQAEGVQGWPRVPR